MFRHVALAACMLSCAPMAVAAHQPALAIQEAPVSELRRDQRSKLRPAYARHSRGTQARPKRKSNRVTLGRRVRRKHRRAA